MRTIAPLAALGGFGLVYLTVRAKRSEAFDLAMSLRIQGLQRPWIRRVMGAVSWPGFPPQSRLIPPAVIAGWLAAGRPKAAALQGAAWGAAALSTVIKAGIRRPRPLPPAVRVVVAPLGGTSFPSGHVLTYVSFYGCLAYLIGVEARPSPTTRALQAALLTLIALIGPSRVEEGHHWATDVTASYLLGTTYLLLLIRLYEGDRA